MLEELSNNDQNGYLVDLVNLLASGVGVGNDVSYKPKDPATKPHER
jgi:hypothetical protein